MYGSIGPIDNYLERKLRASTGFISVVYIRLISSDICSFMTVWYTNYDVVLSWDLPTFNHKQS